VAGLGFALQLSAGVLGGVGEHAQAEVPVVPRRPEPSGERAAVVGDPQL